MSVVHAFPPSSSPLPLLLRRSSPPPLPPARSSSCPSYRSRPGPGCGENVKAGMKCVAACTTTIIAIIAIAIIAIAIVIVIDTIVVKVG